MLNQGSPTRIVTPGQYQAGYLLKVGDEMKNFPFQLIAKQSDGNYLVEEPAEGWKSIY